MHHRDDEGFWILEGDVTFDVGDVTIEAHAGDYAGRSSAEVNPTC